jgi:hypothetical protein
MEKMHMPIITVLLLIVTAISGCSKTTINNVNLNTEATTTTKTSTETKNNLPEPPTNVTGTVLSSNEIEIKWTDEAINEKGFNVYREGSKAGQLPSNTSVFKDEGLKPATNYNYEIRAYNEIGESTSARISLVTKNPAIAIYIDKIGVHQNGESGVRDVDGGEVSAGLVISDGKTTTSTRLPLSDYYKLKNDQVIDVGLQVFSTDSVAQYLRMTVIGYENDGGSGEQMIYSIMDKVVKSYINGPASALLDLSGASFTNAFGSIFGADNDWLGTVTYDWNASQNFGVGQYIDIGANNKDGLPSLRIWFKVVCPDYDYSAAALSR